VTTSTALDSEAHKENPQTCGRHIDVDVVKECFPIWGFASNAARAGRQVLILKPVLEALRRKRRLRFAKRQRKRVEAMRGEGKERARPREAGAGQGQARHDQPALPLRRNFPRRSATMRSSSTKHTQRPR